MSKASFAAIHRRAIERKGGEAHLNALLPEPGTVEALAAKPEARFLAEMARCLFQAGFVWRVIDRKWDGFEAAFHGFDIDALLALHDDAWDAIAKDERIVRNGQKVQAVRANARFIDDVIMERGSFAAFIAEWPCDDLVGLFAVLKKRGSRLGGMTGQRFLRNVGKDCFILTSDVVRALQESGLEVADHPASKRDHAAIQARFNAWHAETQLPYTHLSRIAGFSVGENYPVEQLAGAQAR